MDKLFSERYGYVVKQVQFESLNRVTRGFLWEEVHFVFILQIEKGLEDDDESNAHKNARSFLLDVDRNVFHQSLLNAPGDINQIIRSCENVFINSSWYNVFDIVEYFIKNSSKIFPAKKEHKRAVKVFTEKTNQILIDEKAMYRPSCVRLDCSYHQ